jgi:hypothetical protein
MMNNPQKLENRKMILGISPGTMYTGIAVFMDGELIEYQVKTFYGRITKKKLQRVLNAIQRTIGIYGAEMIAMKIPEGKCTSDKVWQLIKGIENMTDEKQLPIFRYTLSDLKKMCLDDENKTRVDLAEILWQKYPELSFVERSKGVNKHTYYGKMFEAIAAAMQHIIKT